MVINTDISHFLPPTTSSVFLNMSSAYVSSPTTVAVPGVWNLTEELMEMNNDTLGNNETERCIQFYNDNNITAFLHCSLGAKSVG